MPTALVRNCLPPMTGLSDSHAGLCLTRSLREYPEGNLAGQQKKAQIDNVARMSAPKVYKKAFAHWNALAQEQGFHCLQGKLEGRLYIGVVRDNTLETGVTVHHTYGMPMIPGSAVKGVCRAQAKAAGLSEKLLGWIFGAGGDEQKGLMDEAGTITFFDAWWVPCENEKPFVCEVVTPHHQEYYEKEGGLPATDWDSPIPAAQIAVRGSFLFAWDGPEKEAQLVECLLQAALTERGVGSKRSSGYGFFDTEDMEKNKAILAAAAAERIQSKIKAEQAAAIRQEQERQLANASPVLRAMIADGYHEAKRTDAFKGKIKVWLDRMEKEEANTMEIARLLSEWWKKNLTKEWEKPSSASPRSQEHLKRLKNVVERLKV